MKRTRLRPISKKRQAALKEYYKVRLAYLWDNPTCEVCQESCATEIHHKLPRGRGGKLSDLNNFLAVCRACHTFITDHPQWAVEKGYTIK